MRRRKKVQRPGLSCSTRPNLRVMALVPVDSEPIRRQTRRAYDRARKRLESRQRVLSSFEAADVPLFRQWMHATFGERLTRIRELQRQLGDLEHQIEELELNAYEWNCPPWKAWQRMQRGERAELGARDARESERKHKDGDGGAWDTDPFGAGGEEGAPDEDMTEEDMLRMFFEAAQDEFGPPPPDFDFERDILSRVRGRRPAVIPEERERQVKSAYRRLVRRLHPDRHGDMAPALAAIWHEAQDCYRRRDLEGLELLLFRLSVETGEDGGSSVSLLRKLTQDIERSIQAVNRTIRMRRRDLAWGFGQLKNRMHVERTARGDLERQESELRYRAGLLRRHLDQLCQAPRGGGRRRSAPGRRGRRTASDSQLDKNGKSKTRLVEAWLQRRQIL